MSWIRNSTEPTERRPIDIGPSGVLRALGRRARRVGAEPVGDRRQLLPPDQRPQQQHPRPRQGGLRPGIHLGRRRRRAGAAGPSSGSRRAPGGARGGGGMGHRRADQRSARSPDAPRRRHQRPHRRRPGVPVGERRGDHRDRGRDLAVHRAGAETCVLRDGRAGRVEPRCTSGPRSPRMCSAVSSSGSRTAAAVLVAFGSPAGKPSIEEVRAALVDLGYDVAEVRPREGNDPACVGDGRRAHVGRARTASTSSAATSATPRSRPRRGTG